MSTYALVVRDAMLSRLQAKPYFAGFARVSRTKMLQIQPEQLPFLGLYFISESMTPDGDDNAGEPRFHSMARYGFSVIILNNEPDLAEAQLDLAFTQITSLMNDPSLYLNPAAKIQAYASGDRSHSYGSVGLDNELPIAELRFEMNIDLGTITWEPDTPDDLRLIHIEVPYPKVGDPVLLVTEYHFNEMTPSQLTAPSPDISRPVLAEN